MYKKFIVSSLVVNETSVSMNAVYSPEWILSYGGSKKWDEPGLFICGHNDNRLVVDALSIRSRYNISNMFGVLSKLNLVFRAEIKPLTPPRECPLLKDATHSLLDSPSCCSKYAFVELYTVSSLDLIGLDLYYIVPSFCPPFETFLVHQHVHMKSYVKTMAHLRLQLK